MTNEGNTTMKLNVSTKINNDSTIVDRYTTDNINNNVDNVVSNNIGTTIDTTIDTTVDKASINNIINTTNKRFAIVYSFALAKLLIKKGFIVKDIKKNYKINKKEIVFYFDYSEAIDSVIQSYCNRDCYNINDIK